MCCPWYDRAVCCGPWCCPADLVCRTNVSSSHPLCRNVLNLTKRSAITGGPAPKGSCPKELKNPCGPLQTCCMQADKTITCSPFPDATCCEDGIHSCPANYTCQPDTNVCIPPPTPTSAAALYREVVSRTISNIICDEEMECRDWQTCCRTTDGGYGCCPFSKAVCCSDRVHCCPFGHWCDHRTHLCVQPGNIVVMGKLQGGFQTNAIELIRSYRDVTCPDSSKCEDGETCCKLTGGSYGCCPYPNAACCQDGQHCCPYGYVCNVAKGSCDKP